MIRLLDRYRAAGRWPFPRGAVQALRFHRRLSAMFAPEQAQPFTTLATAAGPFDLFEVGERRELWDALRGLEFLSLWPPSSVPAPSPLGKPTSGESRHGDTRSSTPARGVSLDQPAASQRQPVRRSDNAVDSARPRPIVAATPARERPSMPASIFWRTIVHRIPVPQWPSIHAKPRPGASQRDHAGFNPVKTGFNPIKEHDPRDRPEPRVIADARASLQLSWPAPVGRAHPPLDPVATDRRPAKDSSPSPNPLPAVRSTNRVTEATEQTGMRSVRQPDTPDSPWRFLVSQSRGTALGIFQRVLLEPFFPGVNLGDVRVHTDEPADRAARSLSADAFSLGRDIFFRARQFDPSTARGLALIGHELSHTRQILGGEPMQSTVSRRELEHEAASIEGTVLRAFTAGGVRRDEREERGVAPVAGLVPRYVPLSLEPVRAMPAASRDAGGVAAGGQRSIASSAPPGGAASRAQPLKAEQGRPAASAGAASPSSGDDPDAAARTLLRMLERKLRIDKERRGVDRWVR